MTKHQKGFSTLETFLIVLTVVLVASIGWFVWHSNENHPSNKAPNVDSTAAASNTNPNAQYFVIKEWGVRAKYSGKTHLTYSFDTKFDPAHQFALFNSAELKAADPGCMDSDGGAIARFLPTDHVKSESGQDYGPASEFFATTAGKNVSKYVGGYYYEFDFTDASCSANHNAYVLQKQTNDDVSTLLPGLEPVPAQQ